MTIDTKKLREVHDAAPDTIETVSVDTGLLSSCQDEPVPAARNFYEEAHQNMAELLDEVDSLRAERDSLRRELAEQWPIAITARAMCNDEAKEADLREIIDHIGKATDAGKLEYLPTRLRGGS